MNKKILAKVNSLFNLPELSYEGKAKGGFLSDNYILKNKTHKYFLKKYRPSVGDRLPIITKTERFFSRANIPIIMPIKTNQGKVYFKIEDGVYSLYPFIDGKTLEQNNKTPSPIAVKSIATTLALMHLVSKDNYPKFSDKQLSEWDPKKVLSKESQDNFILYANKIMAIINKKAKKSKFDKEASAILKLKLQLFGSIPNKFDSTKLGKGHIVHGDYHAQNVFVNTQGKVTHVFDLEKTDIRPRSLELVRSMFIICFNSYFDDKRFKLAKIYLKAYQEVYPIKQSEITNAVYFMYYKHILNLWIEKGHYLSNYKRADVLLPGELRFLKYLAKNLETLAKR